MDLVGQTFGAVPRHRPPIGRKGNVGMTAAQRVECGRTANFGNTKVSVQGTHVQIVTPFEGDEQEWLQALEWAGVEYDTPIDEVELLAETDQEVFYFELTH